MLTACSRPRGEAPALPTQDAGSSVRAVPASAAPRELAWRFERGPFGPMEVAIAVPGSADPAARFPVLVTFHGRGESSGSGKRGARAWLDDYLLPRASSRLQAPPLRADDFERYVSAERLAQLNAALQAQPYAGLIVVCPSLPDVLEGEQGWSEGEALAAFLVDTLLPRVYAKTPALGSPAGTGVDGVSAGGRAALLVGLSRPRAFGAVGALQAALGASEVARFAERAERARAQNPKLSLRLVSSDEDYFLGPNRALAAALEQRRVPHSLLVVRGTHGYPFNRGPGALEMLLFHSRVLRGETPP